LVGASFVASADAQPAPHRYSPRHGAKCRQTYKRVKHGRKVYCVKRKAKKKAAPPTAAPAAPAPTEKTKLHAHLDPTFTRNPANPFEVTYAYSASASEQTFSTQSLAFGAEEAAPLPSGVLSLFSDGKLECAVNVGSGVEGSECPVSYQALGAHSVTTIYTSGEESATETETEQIEPLPTSTTLSVSYADLEGGPLPVKEFGHCTPPTTNRCEYNYEWLLGEMTVEGTSSVGSALLSCLEGLRCSSAFGGKQLSTALSAPVVLKAHVVTEGPRFSEHPTCEELRSFAGPAAVEYEWSYPTSIGLQATSSASGYATSSAATSLQFAPTLPC
jgi:hypothetical protein